MNSSARNLFWLFAALALVTAMGCHNSENSLTPPPARNTIALEFENPVQIEVDAAHQMALVRHDRNASSGPALELVDLSQRAVVATRFLYYDDVYDVKFISQTKACFAGKARGTNNYRVHFFNLPSLELDSGLTVAVDTLGTHGYLAVDQTAGIVYYTQAGGSSRDAVFKISAATHSFVPASSDSSSGAFDNGLVAGLFNHPSHVFYDATANKLVVTNLGADFVSTLEGGIWGTLRRGDHLTFPVTGTTHLSTSWTGVPTVRPTSVTYGGSIYAFSGMSGSTAYIGTFGVNSTNLDALQTLADTIRVNAGVDVQIHPREDVFSMFVVQYDSHGRSKAIGQYRLNTLHLVTSFTVDSTVSAIGLDTQHDQLIIGDKIEPRLELKSVL